MKNIRYCLSFFAAIFAATAIVISLDAFADPPQPGLAISSLNGSQFQITITNGDATANYQLYWTPVLNDANYPWSVLAVGAQGQTNFTVDGSFYPSGFFRMAVGNDWDGDGVVNWQDANPIDPSVGILSVTIDSPTNGATIN